MHRILSIGLLGLGLGCAGLTVDTNGDPSGKVVAVAGQSTCMQEVLRTQQFAASPDWSWFDASWAVPYSAVEAVPAP